MGKNIAGRIGVIGLLIVIALVSGITPHQVHSASGDFSGDFAAAAPQFYNHATGGGAFNDDTSNTDTVESLEGGQFACGDVVTFFTRIVVDDTAQADIDAPQTIEVDYVFEANSTGQPGVGFAEVTSVSVNYGQVTNGDDYTGTSSGLGGTGLDGGMNDDRQGPTLGPGGTPADLGVGGSTAQILSTNLTGPVGVGNSELLLTIEVDDLERNENVIVRIDVRLACVPESSPTGNVQSYVDAARLTKIQDDVPTDQTISVGNQTIPLKLGGSFGVPVFTDWGDAPDSYGTTLANSGPRHAQSEDLGIGALWDSENDGIPTTDTEGDDSNNTDDEDGVTPPTLRVGDTSATVQVDVFNSNATDDATLRCWMDFDLNDVFDVGESQATTIPANTALTTYNLNFSFIGPFSSGDVIYIRCRVAYDTTQVDNPTGDAASGEVEDWRTMVVDPPLAVTLGSFEATHDGNIVTFDWVTSTETGNAGFNLYAETAEGMVQLNRELIHSSVIDSVVHTVYQYAADTDGSQFYIELVGIDGRTQLHGPFTAQPAASQIVSTIFLPLAIQ